MRPPERGGPPFVRRNVTSTQPAKLLDRVRTLIRARHYSPRTETSYLHWIRRFIRFHGRRHPAAMGSTEIAEFVSSLAERGVSASTQN